jgi:hypothetical protein
MEEENGFDDSSPSGLRFPSPWVPAKVFVLARDTRKTTLAYIILGGKAS